MIKSAAHRTPAISPAVWGVLAILVGVAAARAPFSMLAGLLGAVTLAFVVLIEPVLGLILMLAVAPLKTLIATESPLPLPLDIGQISLGLTIGVWAIWRVTRQRFEPLPRSRVYLPLIIIMAGFCPSLFGALSPGAWISEFLKWIEILLLVMIVLDLGRERRWTWIAFGVVLAGTLQAVIGVYEYFGGSGAPHLWTAGYLHFRAFGTFGQPNPFSAFMGLSLPLALGLAWGYASQGFTLWRAQRSPARPWLGPALLATLYAGMGLILLAGLLVSLGRGAWMGFGAAGVVMVFFAPRKRWQGVLLFAGACTFVAGLWLVGYIPAAIQQRINNALTEFVGFRDVRGVPISNDNFAIIERLAHWQAAYYMANDHPWIGVGLGSYEAAYPQYRLPGWPRPLGHAHNDYLNLLAETGVIGLSAYLVGWAVIGWWTLGALRQPDPVLRGLVLGLLGTWVHLAVHSIVDKLYVNNLFLHLGVMLGLLAVAIISCPQKARRLE